MILLTAALAALSATQSELLVSSRNSDEVLLYDETGQFVRVFTTGGDLGNPVGLAFGPNGNLFVANADNSRVDEYDGQTGAFVRVFTNDVGSPRNLNFGLDGDLYVCDGSSSAVIRLDGETGRRKGFMRHPSLSGPTSLTFGPDFNLYVGSVLTSSVIRFDGRTGAFIDVFAFGNMNGTHDLSFGPDGDLYVSNAFASTISRFDGSTGQFKSIFVSDAQLVNALGLTWGLDGDLFVANQGKDQVRRYDGITGRRKQVFVTGGSGGLDSPLFAIWRHDRGGLRFLPPTPAGVDVDAHFATTGGQAGGLAVIAIGVAPGSLPLPCPGLALGIADPLVLGFGAADESGTLVTRLFVPRRIRGASLLFQPLDLTACTVGPIATHRF